jgi:hypothetical protein
MEMFNKARFKLGNYNMFDQDQDQQCDLDQIYIGTKFFIDDMKEQ